MTCEDFIKLLEIHQDELTSLARKPEVLEHTHGCTSCREEIQGLQNLEVKLQKINVPLLTPEEKLQIKRSVMLKLRARAGRPLISFPLAWLAASFFLICPAFSLWAWNNLIKSGSMVNIIVQTFNVSSILFWKICFPLIHFLTDITDMMSRYLETHFVQTAGFQLVTLILLYLAAGLAKRKTLRV